MAKTKTPFKHRRRHGCGARALEYYLLCAPYEPPRSAALVLDTGGQSIDACIRQLLAWLSECAVLPA
ncbi:hypothetical protein [Pseudomonas fluorescens]|uniref:hypothetical protein n=1 Tax=Pseudomonas fluorescens TaxID=294 RepID=UPI00398FCBB9